MGKKRELKATELAQIVSLRDAKWTLKRIAEYVRCSISTVTYTLSKFKKTGSFGLRSGRGRKSALTDSDERYLAQAAVRNRRATLSEVTHFLTLQEIKMFVRQLCVKV